MVEALDKSLVRVWKKVLESDLENLGLELKEAVETPAVIILTGPVGAGKTTFVQRFLGQGSSTQSPTYSIVNEIGDVAHADFYRVESDEDIEHLELSFYLEDKNYFLVEWGRPFLKELERSLSVDFSYFELEISVNTDKNPQSNEPSRNFSLHKFK
jgi:tRNA threonylcarbamoyladenosine biosynthesis protein TsaE